MATTTMPGSIEAHISGEISGQIAVGNNIIQYNVDHGGVVNIAAPGETPTPRARPRPVMLRGRRPPTMLGRKREATAGLGALGSGNPIEFVGPPGVGKTTILKHLAHHAPPEVAADGVVYHEAHGEPVDDTLQFLWEAFYETKVPFKPTEAQIRHELAGVRAVVVLDDLSVGREDVALMLDTLPEAMFVFASARRSLWGGGSSVPMPGLDADAGVALLEQELGRPFEADERDAAAAIVAAVDGNPLALLQAAALVAELGFELPELCRKLTKGSAPDELGAILLEALDDQQRDVLELLAGLGGATLPADQLAELVGVDDATPIVEGLLKLGLIQAHSPRYSVAGPTAVASAAPRRWGPAARRHFIGWAESNRGRPEVVLEETGAVLEVLAVSARDEAWADLLRLGRAVEGPLMLGRRWGAWREVVQLELTAARRVGDRPAEAWALHQLGSRALCLEDRATARSALTGALAIREALGDAPGAAVTRHNLGLLTAGKPVAKSAALVASSGPLLSVPFLLLLGVVALVIAVAGGVVIAVTQPDGRATTGGGGTTAQAEALTIEPAVLAFGDQPIGTASAPRTVQVVNNQARTATMRGVSLAGPGAASYQVSGDCAGATLAPGAACSIVGVFTPVVAGAQDATVTLTADGLDPPAVTVTGAGTGSTVSGAVRLSPASLEFGRREIGETTGAQLVTVTATAEVDLGSVSIGGQNAADFAIVNRCGARLGASERCTVEVRFAPTADGPRVATLALAPTRNNQVASTVLTGVGVRTGRPPPPPVAIDIVTPPDQTVVYGSSVLLRIRSTAGGLRVTLGGSVPVGGLIFTDLLDSTGVISGTVTARPSTMPVTVTLTGKVGDGPAVTETFRLTVVAADVAIRWAQPLLDLRAGPAIANAVLTQPGGTTGDLTKAMVAFDFTDVVSGVTKAFPPVPVSASGATSITLVPGDLALGAYTARARLVTPNEYFRMAPGTSPPTAVVVNTDALGASVYTLSDLLNLITP